jgi:hypothetical protein
MSNEKEATPNEGMPNFVDLLATIPGSPNKEQIDVWKNQHGDVFCSAFSETELFIWRPVARVEWREHQLKLAQAHQDGEALDPFVVEESLVNKCLLWSSEMGKKALSAKAGSLGTLHEQLLQNSNFVDPRLASNLVVKL